MGLGRWAYLGRSSRVVDAELLDAEQILAVRDTSGDVVRVGICTSRVWLFRQVHTIRVETYLSYASCCPPALLIAN